MGDGAANLTGGKAQLQDMGFPCLWVLLMASLVSCDVRIACIATFAYFALRYWGEGASTSGEALITWTTHLLVVVAWFAIAMVPRREA